MIKTNEKKEEHKLIIRPKRHFLEVNLKEIVEYKDLIFLFVRRNIVSKYKQTILGPLWFFLGPLFSTLVYMIVFNRIAEISTDGAPPILFYLSGIVCWNYFSSCLVGNSTTFIANAGIFGKVYFPRLVTPISTLISNLFLFLIQFSLLIILILYFKFSGYNITPNITMLFIPFYILLLAIIAMGFGIIISSLTTKYRDLTQLMGFGVQLWMYATPVIYPVSAVPKNLKQIVLLNPVAPVFEAFKFSMLGIGNINVQMLIYSAVFALIVLFIGIITFNKVEQTFMDTV